MRTCTYIVINIPEPDVMSYIFAVRGPSFGKTTFVSVTITNKSPCRCTIVEYMKSQRVCELILQIYMSLRIIFLYENEETNID